MMKMPKNQEEAEECVREVFYKSKPKHDPFLLGYRSLPSDLEIKVLVIAGKREIDELNGDDYIQAFRQGVLRLFGKSWIDWGRASIDANKLSDWS